MKLKIYTDGSCLKSGVGGIGAVMLYENEVKLKLAKQYKDTTNNRMELTACVDILRKLPRKCDIELFTDSKYVITGITEWITNWKKNGWKTTNKKTDVKNRDLWEELDLLNNSHNITWNWVKGHNGDTYNEMCDKLANDAANSYNE